MNLFRLFGQFPRLKTERFLLKPLKSKNWEMVYDLYNEESVAQYNPWGKINTPKQARQKISQYQQEFRYHQKVRWGIFDKKNQEILGNCVISNLNFNQQQAEIGFNLYPNHWGKGIMTEVLATILVFLFEEVGLKKIEAWVMVENWRCRKMLEKLGFSPEFILKKSIINREICHDFWVMSLRKIEI